VKGAHAKVNRRLNGLSYIYINKVTKGGKIQNFPKLKQNKVSAAIRQKRGSGKAWNLKVESSPNLNMYIYL